MKKVMVLGTGAQGSTVAMRLDQEPNVSEIICADYDKRAVDSLVKRLEKGRGIQVDATKTANIVAAAEGVDLIVNALPLEFAKYVLDAALELKTNYQDFAAGVVLDMEEGEEPYKYWLRGIRHMYDDYGRRFRKIGKLAIIGTGSAPGFICVTARKAMDYLDTCETITMLVYEGLEAKRFLPFWWSPVTALSDMHLPAFAFENGEIIATEAFSRPIKRVYPETGDKEITAYEHSHDEPIYMGFNSEKYFKGAKNIYFKYGGVGIDFAQPLYRAGLLSQEEEEINGRKVVPFDVILAHIPPAPKYREEIQEILDEGLVSEAGAAVVECVGKKDGKDIIVEAHISTPGIEYCFERAGMTAEMYFTGQGGFLFTKMFVNDKYNQTGLISSDMLDEEQVKYYLDCASKLELNVDFKIKEL